MCEIYRYEQPIREWQEQMCWRRPSCTWTFFSTSLRYTACRPLLLLAPLPEATTTAKRTHTTNQRPTLRGQRRESTFAATNRNYLPFSSTKKTYVGIWGNSTFVWFPSNPKSSKKTLEWLNWVDSWWTHVQTGLLKTKEIVHATNYISVICDDVTSVNNTSWILVHCYVVQNWSQIPIFIYLERVINRETAVNLTKVIMSAVSSVGGLRQDDISTKLLSFGTSEKFYQILVCWL